MAKRVFETDLSVKGIEQLKKNLLYYKIMIQEYSTYYPVDSLNCKDFRDWEEYSAQHNPSY